VGQFAPWSNKTLANSLPGAFIPWNFHSLELLLQRAYAPGNFRSLELALPYCKSYNFLKLSATKNLHRPQHRPITNTVAGLGTVNIFCTCSAFDELAKLHFSELGQVVYNVSLMCLLLSFVFTEGSFQGMQVTKVDGRATLYR